MKANAVCKLTYVSASPVPLPACLSACPSVRLSTTHCCCVQHKAHAESCLVLLWLVQAGCVASAGEPGFSRFGRCRWIWLSSAPFLLRLESCPPPPKQDQPCPSHLLEREYKIPQGCAMDAVFMLRLDAFCSSTWAVCAPIVAETVARCPLSSNHRACPPNSYRCSGTTSAGLPSTSSKS